ncbi:MAG: HAD family phosphatase [Oscillospiraceae bacterium]|nr:HAD family phosphatase [Oscillospiraceae bacterium]
MERYAVFFDLDGTLLTTDKRVTERNRRALELAHSKGAYIVPTTGRIYDGMPDAVRELPFIDYAITVNGAEVYDVKAGCALKREEIPAPRAIEIFDIMEEFDCIYDCYAKGWGYMQREHYEKADEYVIEQHMRKMVKSVRTPVDDIRRYVISNFESVQKLQMFFRDIEENIRASEYLKKTLDGECITSSIRGNLEINSERANKGEGLRFLCSYLGVPIENSVAFGDGSNDITMIRAAGTGVAMGNAIDEVKRAAKLVAAGNDEDGVALTLEKLFG